MLAAFVASAAASAYLFWAPRAGAAVGAGVSAATAALLAVWAARACARRLLVLSVGQGARRARPLLIPADALDAASFSALSVLARSAGAAGRA